MLCSIVHNGFAACITKFGFTLSASAAHELTESSYIGRELWLSGPWAMGGQWRKTVTYKYSKKVALLSLNNGSAILGTRALAIAEQRVKSKEKRLFTAFGAAFHPLPLRH